MLTPVLVLPPLTTAPVAQNRLEFQQVALDRFADAKALLTAGRYNGAYYLGGYAVECALKACIAKLTLAGDFPPKNSKDYYTHNLKELLTASKLKSDLEQDSVLRAEWSFISGWSEATRYNTAQITQTEAEVYLNLVQNASDTTKGILPWLQARW